jgi:hypothetical protein
VLDGGFDRSLDMRNQGNFFTAKGNFADDVPVKPAEDETGYYSTIATGRSRDRMPCRNTPRSTPIGRSFTTSRSSPRTFRCTPAGGHRPLSRQVSRGWDAMRAARFARQQETGLRRTTLSKLEPDVGPPYHFPDALEKLGPGEVNRPLPWEELTDEQRRFQATKMAIHAAMVDRMDREIGRLLDSSRRWAPTRTR